MNSTAELVDLGTMITRTPGIKGGTPHIVGTGVTVRTIIRRHHSGSSPEEIAVDFGHITLAQVYAALAFYYCNQAVMDREMREEEDESNRLEREHLAMQRRLLTQA